MTAYRRRWLGLSSRTLFAMMAAVGASMALSRLGLTPIEIVFVAGGVALATCRCLEICDDLRPVRFDQATH